MTASLSADGLTKRLETPSPLATSTMRMLAGIIRPATGPVFVQGMDIARVIDAIKSRIGYVAQYFVLYPELTVSVIPAFYSSHYRRVPRS